MLSIFHRTFSPFGFASVPLCSIFLSSPCPSREMLSFHGTPHFQTYSIFGGSPLWVVLSSAHTGSCELLIPTISEDE